MSFLNRDLSEEEREEIRAEAKQIMDSFGKVLEKVEDLDVEGFVSRESSFREETESVRDEKFKERMLKNAPNKNKDFLIAEKKKW